MNRPIFISHATQDDATVRQVREVLELHGNLPWVDSRALTGGDALRQTLEEQVRNAGHFVAVLSIDALSSEWVQQEVRWAMDTAATRSDDYKVITLVLPGVQPGLLKLLFPSEPLHIFVADGPPVCATPCPSSLPRWAGTCRRIGTGADPWPRRRLRS